PRPSGKRADDVRDEYALVRGRFFERLVGERGKVDRCSFSVDRSRRACRDPRVDEHRCRQVLDQQPIAWSYRFVVEIELSEVGLLHPPVAEEAVNTTYLAIDPSGSVDELHWLELTADRIV